MTIKRDYKNVEPQMYAALFNTTEGQAVLEDLLARFYYIESYTRGDSLHMAYQEGMRFVMGFINNRIIQGEQQPNAPLKEE